MIFVTIGSQEPFDRLISAVDNIAASLDVTIVAQTFRSEYHARHIKTLEFISPIEYNEYINKADIVIAHAGMGTILSVLQLDKPLIVMPRLAKYHETRNNHQVATAIEFEKLGYLSVAYDGCDLENKIRNILDKNERTMHKINGTASPLLISSIKSFIEGVAARP
jgi:UDP-N-acetylglucosamine transferase subunit ALG13